MEQPIAGACARTAILKAAKQSTAASVLTKIDMMHSAPEFKAKQQARRSLIELPFYGDLRLSPLYQN
jgi:hypothetical protein